MRKRLFILAKPFNTFRAIKGVTLKKALIYPPKRK